MIQIEKTATLKFDGTEEKHTKITVRCDGPKCKTTTDINICRYEIQWQEEQSDDIPDQAFRVMVHKDGIHLPDKHFFSRACLRDYMRDVYVPPESPREQAQRMGGTVVSTPKPKPDSNEDGA